MSFLPRTHPRRVFLRGGLTALALSAQLPLRRAAADSADVRELQVLVHPGLSIVRLSEAELAAIYTRAMKTWESKHTLRPLNLPANSPGRVLFDQVVLKLDPERSARFWIDKMVRGEGTPPRQIPSPELIARVVKMLPGALGYGPPDLDPAGARVVARIRNGKVVAP